MENKSKGSIKVIIGIILVIVAGFLPYFVLGISTENDDNTMSEFAIKLSMNQYVKDSVAEYREMATTKEQIEYVSSEEFKNAVSNEIQFKLNTGDYSAAYGLMDSMKKVLIKLGIACSVTTLIIYIVIINSSNKKKEISLEDNIIDQT